MDIRTGSGNSGGLSVDVAVVHGRLGGAVWRGASCAARYHPAVPESDPPPSDPPPDDDARMRAWFALVLIARRACIGMIQAMQQTDPGDFALPKRGMFALVARTLGNLAAVEVLLPAFLIVEARTITRCIVENLFMAASILKRPNETFEMLGKDFGKSRIMQARFHAERGEDTLPDDLIERLTQFARDVEARYPKGGYLNQKRIAEGTFAEKAYGQYSLISDDSAHATMTSMARHILTTAPDATTLIDVPEPKVGEICGTARMACEMTLGIILATREIFGGTGGQHVEVLNDALAHVRTRFPIDA